jgi:hypothetical protein
MGLPDLPTPQDIGFSRQRVHRSGEAHHSAEYIFRPPLAPHCRKYLRWFKATKKMYY